MKVDLIRKVPLFSTLTDDEFSQISHIFVLRAYRKGQIIFLEEETGFLFGVLKVEDPANMDLLPAQAIMKKWWAYMKDIMESNPDNSPVSVSLTEVFYMP